MTDCIQPELVMVLSGLETNHQQHQGICQHSYPSCVCEKERERHSWYTQKEPRGVAVVCAKESKHTSQQDGLHDRHHLCEHGGGGCCKEEWHPPPSPVWSGHDNDTPLQAVGLPLSVCEQREGERGWDMRGSTASERVGGGARKACIQHPIV
jgi:hypothetical protein